MDRIARFDISRRIARPGLRHLAQIGFGIGCAAAMIAIRGVLDLVAANAGPFALVYPTVVLATLYGHWRAGLTAYLLAFFWAWYVVLPHQWSFAFENPSDLERTIINAAAALVVLIVPEGFRSAVAAYRDESQRALDRRLILLAELEHRTKNNFALVAGMLEIQKRRVEAPEAVDALDDAIGRVRTFATAYSNLAMEQSEGAEVDMKPYLQHIIDRVARGSFSSDVAIDARIESMQLPREIGVAIGLYLNEALLNCAKYAFSDGAPGSIQVHFEPREDGWRLSVEDDGRAAQPKPEESGGLGSRLMSAFAQQAGAQHTARPSAMGYAVELVSP